MGGGCVEVEDQVGGVWGGGVGGVGARGGAEKVVPAAVAILCRGGGVQGVEGGPVGVQEVRLGVGVERGGEVSVLVDGGGVAKGGPWGWSRVGGESRDQV